MPTTVAFTVNGRAVNVVVAYEDTPLLAALRNELRLMGTRFGCGVVVGCASRA